ncbi:amidohydrolase [Fluviispira sanaruensis]|uniref:Amidohydrolase n=1 Tax=Fluviispira sanaruensis TaxID=2493639 RepID=A0A4P2VL24_FLUSA|nr:amidohydrolase [Fluviispira sanaruensis]BBH52634.1 amidohydrolase [Fluviispira sanaruensis]
MRNLNYILMGLIVFLILTIHPLSSAKKLEYADLLLYNGKIFTAEREKTFAQAVVIKNGKIIFVGTNNQAKKWVAQKSIDLEGKVLLPGLIDTHAHPIQGGFSELVGFSLHGELLTIPNLKSKVTEAIVNKSAFIDDVIYINSVSTNYWSNIEDLHSLFNADEYIGTPIVLAGDDGHTAWVNQAMLEKSGISKEFISGLAEREQKFYGRDSQNNPNGFVSEEGFDTVRKNVSLPSNQLMIKAGQAAVNYFNSQGITAWVDAISNAYPTEPMFTMNPSLEHLGAIPIYEKLAKLEKLTVHVGALVASPKADLNDLKTIELIREKYKHVPNFSILGVKIFADGVPEYPTQTAALSKPYSNSGAIVPTIINPSTFGLFVTEADKRNLLVHIHAIGDEAVKTALDGVALARKTNGNSGINHTIAHLQFVDPNDFSRFKKLGVAASMQLMWAVSNPSTVELLKPYIDAKIYRYIYPTHSLLSSHALVVGGSDWPVSSANPWVAITRAITRKTTGSTELIPEEKVKLEDMLFAYTIDAAKALRMQEKIGSIEIGKYADFTLLNQDIFKISSEDLLNTKSVWTMFKGKFVYMADKKV